MFDKRMKSKLYQRYRVKRKEWSGKQVLIDKESGVYSNFSADNICSLYHWYENKMIVILHGSLLYVKEPSTNQVQKRRFYESE